MILNDNKSSKGATEVATQTDLSLSDISRLEDLKAVLLDER